MSATKPLDTRDLEYRVKQMYTDVATYPERLYHFETGRQLAERLGYPPGGLDEIPAASIASFAGVGYFHDLAEIHAGAEVIDLGSGSGMDSFFAARRVGPDGRVIGVDMTEAQVKKAAKLAATAGLLNVEFNVGHIERLPVPDGTVDLVISNGVVNLSPDKAAVFAEAARVLRPGGRLALADIVTERPLPDGVSCDASLWAACIGGAMQIDDYRDVISRAGLRITAERINDEYRFLSDRAANATRQWDVHSISLVATLASRA